MTTYLCEICFDALTTHSTDAWDGLETAVCDTCLAPPVGDAAWRDVAAMGRRAELETALAHFDTFAASVAAAYAQARQPAPERAGALGLASSAMSACEQWQQAMLNRAAMFAFQPQAYSSLYSYQQQRYPS